MKIYAHTNYLVPGYTRLTHEAIELQAGAISDVPEAVGQMLLGAHPLQFCAVADRETVEAHSCVYWPKAERAGVAHVGTPPPYDTTDMPAPPVSRQMKAKPKPKRGSRRKSNGGLINRVLGRN